MHPCQYWRGSGLLTAAYFPPRYLAMPIGQPLVLLFAGPSGHGKTELARNLGGLISLDLHSVDCTTPKHESDLFGPWRPYQGWEEGSSVNNFLATNNNRRCIIFMDEFEKTTDEVRRALLVPFQSGEQRGWKNWIPGRKADSLSLPGEYRDRRSHDQVNCKQQLALFIPFCGCRLSSFAPETATLLPNPPERK